MYRLQAMMVVTDNACLASCISGGSLPAFEAHYGGYVDDTAWRCQ